MNDMQAGIHVWLRYAPHGTAGSQVDPRQSGGALARLGLRTRHHPDALLLTRRKSLGNGQAAK
jgi:hypothetical protein